MCSELFPNTTMDVTVSSQDLPPPTFHLARHIFNHSGLRVVHISILCYSQKNYCIIKWLWNVNFQWAIWKYDNIYNFMISISLNFWNWHWKPSAMNCLPTYKGDRFTTFTRVGPLIHNGWVLLRCHKTSELNVFVFK